MKKSELRQIIKKELKEISNNLTDFSKILKVGDIILTKIDKRNPDRCIYIEDVYYKRDYNRRGLALDRKSQIYILTKFGKWDNNKDRDIDIYKKEKD